MIEIEDLSKYYGDKKALGPLSFTIGDGEIVGLLGLNGAGKTTALRILACDLLPTSGTVRVDGLDVVERPDEVRRRVGYLPDIPPLYGEMTVHEQLLFAARLRGLPRAEAEKRVEEAEEATSVSTVRDDPVTSLSHGFRQRVGIAQAIVHRPRLLVLDEPISGLDPIQIVEMRKLLRGLRGEHTILLSSHILPEISETCDRILVIRDGRIVAAGTEAELSAMLGRVSCQLTVRGEEALAAAALRAVDGVLRVERAAQPAEQGEGLLTLLVEAERDVREAACRALVHAGLGLLGVTRADRELESAFLALTGADARDGEGGAAEDGASAASARSGAPTGGDGGGAPAAPHASDPPASPRPPEEEGGVR